MASTLSTLAQVTLTTTETGGDDASGLPARLVSALSIPAVTLADGSGAGQASKRSFKKITIAAGANTTLDLAGGLVDPRGNAVSFTRITELLVYNSATVAGDIIRMGNAASNPVPLGLSAATTTIDIGPGGWRFMHEPSAAGLPVVNAASDNLKLANIGANSIDVVVAVVGS